jgi:hypothetical protein
LNLIAFKLTATPLLIAAATLAARRWGQTVGGWLVGLPLTSGPVTLFLALDQGTPFAADSALGSLQGVMAQGLFGAVFARLIPSFSWPATLSLASIAYIAAAAILHALALSLPILFLLCLPALALSLLVMPPSAQSEPSTITPPRWDLPARMAVATSLVLGITALAPALGPVTSGVTASYPVFATTLAVFAKRSYGALEAVRVLRGLVMGLYAFTAFFFVIGEAIVPLGVSAAFALGIAVAFAVQGATLIVVHSLRPG